MDAFSGPAWKPRIASNLNLLTIIWLSARMTAVLWARRAAETLSHLPWMLRRRLTPARATFTVALIALLATGCALYLTERARHHQAMRAYREVSVESAAETRYLRSILLELLDEQARLASAVLASGGTLSADGYVYVRVLATGYSSSVAETDETPFVTAANTPTRPGTLALSRDLLREYTPGAPFSFGDRVRVHGLGEFLVEDVMNARWSNRIDVWFPSRDEALWFGRREMVISRSLEARPADGLPILSGDFSTRLALGGL
jgi:3D (Asp-Asp-Asp) domain-containing protein